MAPTVRELAKVTITRETQERWSAAVNMIADLMKGLVDAVIEMWAEVRKAVISLFDGIGSVHQAHYPGVPQGFSRRGLSSRAGRLRPGRR